MIYLDKNARLERLANEQDKERGKVNLVSDTDTTSLAIVELIRQNYTLTEEVAILRKTLAKIVPLLNTSNTDLTEFNEYNARVEQAKQEVKENNN